MTEPTRQSRSKRRSGARMKLTARDEALLAAVSRFRLCRGADIGRLFFAGRHPDVLRDRLRKLYDGGFLEVHARDRATPNLYSLGPAGRTFVKSRELLVGAVPRPPVDHHLAVVSLWSQVAAAAHSTGSIKLTSFVPDWITRSQAGGLTVVPDAQIELRRGSDVVSVAAEVDLGNECMAVLRAKLRAYAATAGAGAGELTLLLVLDGRGMSRGSRVRELLKSEWVGPGEVVTLPDVTAKLLEELCRAPVTASRCGNGNDAGVSGCQQPSIVVTGGGLSVRDESE